MRKKSCCFAGHGIIPATERQAIQKCLDSEISELINKGVDTYYAGTSMGFDTLAALTVLRFKESYPHIKLKLILPRTEKVLERSDANRKIYELILRQADEVIYISDEYSTDSYLERNRRLVDSSDYCLCYIKKNVGGTAYTLSYAKAKRLSIVYVYNKQSVSRAPDFRPSAEIQCCHP